MNQALAQLQGEVRLQSQKLAASTATTWLLDTFLSQVLELLKASKLDSMALMCQTVLAILRVALLITCHSLCR